MAEKKSLKGYYLTTFLIGLGFFTMGLMDPLYDTYIPIFLGKFIDSAGLIGLIMTFDNILAIFLIPLSSALSDRVSTRIGRRMPFIVTLLPLSALLFALIPFSALSSLVLLIALVFCFNLCKQSVRGPVVALMPDMVPGDLRSEANGVINTMGGIATILGTIGLARLMDVPVRIPGSEQPVTDILAFPVASVFVIIAVVLLFIFVKEKNSTVPKESSKKESEPVLKSLKVVLGEREKQVSAFHPHFPSFLVHCVSGSAPVCRDVQHGGARHIIRNSISCRRHGWHRLCDLRNPFRQGRTPFRAQKDDKGLAPCTCGGDSACLCAQLRNRRMEQHCTSCHLLGTAFLLRNFLGIRCYELIPDALADVRLHNDRHLYRALLFLQPGCKHHCPSDIRSVHRSFRLSVTFPLHRVFHGDTLLHHEKGRQGRT